MLATWHFHIEISSKCTLKCPRCARQEVPSSLVNTELRLDFFEKNFSKEFIINNVEKITFCGDDGDPIYAHDLIEVITYFKKIKDVEIVIVTNGSYKSIEWWQQLGHALSKKDSVHFSIDGWDNPSNNLYRKNSDYDSIIQGISALRKHSQCQIVWATILFKFNQEHIDKIRTQAVVLGVNRFQITKSTKFGSVYPSYGSNDILEPAKINVSKSYRFERIYEDFTEFQDKVYPINISLYTEYKNSKDIVPLCNIGNKGLYIDANGRLFPCCWVANRYSHNNEWQSIADRFNLNLIDLKTALADKFWITDMLSYRWTECKTKCSSAVVTEEYATSW